MDQFEKITRNRVVMDTGNGYRAVYERNRQIDAGKCKFERNAIEIEVHRFEIGLSLSNIQRSNQYLPFRLNKFNYDECNN